MSDNILENYLKQVEEDKKNENNDLPNGIKREDMTDEQYELYQKELNKLRQQSNAEAEAKKRFNETYIKISEESLISTDKLAVEDATIKVKRAYCPHCGKEIVSKLPSMWYPYTGEKICRYDCECGFKANLEYTYPRLVILDKDGNELDIQF